MEIAITVSDIKKMYRMYDRPVDHLKELLSPTKKKYFREHWALGGVSFEVGRGEALGIMGRNGSGKSTLLKIICGVLKPTSGSVQTHGRISALLELGTGFNPEFTGRENVYISGALMGLSRKEIDGRFDYIQEFADIGRFIEQPVKKYSSGMYVRLAFACAVNVDPEILVVDEALAVGDAFFQQKCYRRISEFREQGKTILLVSHSLGAIQKHCDRAIFLDEGRISAQGDTRNVINSYLETISTRGEAARPDVSPDEKGKHAGTGGRIGPPPADTCAAKPNYNPNELRYGNGKARIVDFSIKDCSGAETVSTACGETVSFSYTVKAYEPVEAPIYGMILKTKDGVTLYGNNTWYDGIEVAPLSAGETVTVEFKQRMMAAAGDYFLSFGVAERSGDEVDAVDRRYDMALLHVLPADRSFGLANLFSEINIRQDAPTVKKPEGADG